MDKPALESVVHSFVTSGMDYCNAVLFGCTTNVIDKLQKLQNCAARVVVGGRKFEHITPVLKELHWLPVTSRTKYKIALMVFKAAFVLDPSFDSSLKRTRKSNKFQTRVDLNRSNSHSCSDGE